jgi:hypothetical protein
VKFIQRIKSFLINWLSSKSMATHINTTEFVDEALRDMPNLDEKFQKEKEYDLEILMKKVDEQTMAELILWDKNFVTVSDFNQHILSLHELYSIALLENKKKAALKCLQAMKHMNSFSDVINSYEQYPKN